MVRIKTMVRIKPLDTLAHRRRFEDRLTCLLRPHHGTTAASIPNTRSRNGALSKGSENA